MSLCQECECMHKFLLNRLRIYAKGCYSHKRPLYQLTCVKHIHSLLSCNQYKIINTVIKTGVVPQLIRMLNYYKHPQLQCESLDVLIRITSGNEAHAELLLNNQITYYLSKIIQSNITNNETKANALLCLRNIAAVNNRIKNKLLTQYNVYYACIVPILSDVSAKNSSDLMVNAARTLSLLSYHPSAHIFNASFISSFIRLCKISIASNTNEEFLTHIFYAIYFSLGNNPTHNLCKQIIDEMFNVFGDIFMEKKMINVLKDYSQNSKKQKLHGAIIDLIADIVAVDDYEQNGNQWIHTLIKLKVLNRLRKILRTTNGIELQDEIFDIISNIAIDFKLDEFITCALCKHKVMETVYKILHHAKCIRVKAAQILFHIIGSCQYIHEIESIYKLSKIIPLLFSFFNYQNDASFTDRFSLDLLNIVQHLLSFAKYDPAYCKVAYSMYKCSAVDVLKLFKLNLNDKKTNDQVTNTVDVILETLVLKQRQYLRCNARKCVMSYGTDCGSAINKTQQFYRCSGCSFVVYCSHRCQKWDWKHGHKAICTSLNNP